MADDSYVKEIQVRNLTNTMIDVVNGIGPGGGGGPANWNTMINKPATFAPIIGSLATQAVAGNDSRLTNARTPTAHNQNASTINAGVMDVARLGTGTATSAKILYGDSTWRDAPAPGEAIPPVDASTSVKGVVRLAGDLAGTAASPTVPGLTGKANTAHNHNASAINAGVMDAARLGTGTANGTTILFGDGTWRAAPSGGGSVDISGKVDKVSAPNTVYVTDQFGQQDGIGYSNSPSSGPPSLVLRGPSSQILVRANPTDTAEAVHKQYVDDAIANAGGGGGADPRIITGAGRPDIPATLSTGVADLVAGAGSATEFRSTDGPQGAWVWMKRGASWVVTDGHTGERKITLPVTDDVESGYVVLSRSNAAVRCTLQDVQLAAGSGSTSVWSSIPRGFRIAGGDRTMQGIGLSNNATKGQMMSVFAGFLYWLFTMGTPSNSLTRPTTGLAGSLYWTLAADDSNWDDWPVVLPGVAN